jgi:light-regulated signal transduction histidine kinase (bacteriophytochrome)
MEAAMSAIQDSNPWLAADLRDASSQKRLVAGLILALESADRARKAAERANLAKSSLLTAATRKLRQPLMSLSRLNGTLRRLVSERDALDAIRQQEQVIGAMSQLLNTMFDISKLDSWDIRPELTHRLRSHSSLDPQGSGAPGRS